jgi:formylglycine-generating enzyme required for sulfatase activity
MAQLADGTRLIRLPAEISGGDMVHLAATPVTNAQYRRFLEATGYASPPTWARAAFRRPDAPVVGVTWFEAMAYAAWCGGDLPSRAEWEWAATGGDPGVEYGTAQGRLSQAMAHFGVALGEGAPCPSEAYPPNRLAFSGMCGNTWDWCRTSDGSHQVICGGGYMDAALFCRARAAYRNAAIDRDCCVGFRIRIVLR